MCFEVLGFDVMLDKNCEPYLLEVNHAPSFACDAQIDEAIKYDVIKDTLNLVSITVKERQEIIKKMDHERYERFIGVSKTKQGSMKDLHNKPDSGWLENEKANLGKYKLIYPLENKVNDQLFEQLESVLQNTDTSPTKVVENSTRESPTPRRPTFEIGTMVTKQNQTTMQTMLTESDEGTTE